MKYLLLFLCLLSAGCIPVIADNPLVLDEPIVLTSDKPVTPEVTPQVTPEVTPQAEPPKPKVEPPKAVTVKPVVVKPTYRWTYPGDLGTHLRSVHGVDAIGMSRSEMLQIHDDLHNSQLAVKAPAAKEYIVIQYTIDSCGWCKYDEKNIFPKWAAQGWKFQKVNETANPRGVYPRYEIRWVGGKTATHSGSLSTWKN
jgi:hypothetical protein